MKPLEDQTEPELKATFNIVAKAVKERLPPGTGFIVLAAPFGSNGIAQYVSNVDRHDAALWMCETIQRWEANDFVTR